MAVESRAPRVAAIIPAAGRGVRMGGQPKQFRTIGGYPLLVQTARAFDSHPYVEQIVLAVPAGAEESVTAMFSAAAFTTRLHIVPGGASRTASVCAGVEAVEGGVEVILIHDAVRPFLMRHQIDAVIDAAWSTGAASLAIPVSDTLRRTHEGKFGALVPREEVVRIQTPQGFRRPLLQSVLAEHASGTTEFTDDASLVMASGHTVSIVRGSSLNFKLTTEEDWRMASLLWPAWEAQRQTETP